jgi:predicted TIM-barrel fold metal-dependent hydrolase
MMIVDFHYHLMPRMTESSVSALMPLLSRAADIMGRRLDMEALKKKGLETWADPAGERLLETMEAAGIDYAVICMVDDASYPGLKAESVQKGNRLLGSVAFRNPDRVGGLCGIDPRRPEAPDMLKQSFEEFGVIGMKYHPDYGFDPAGPESYRLLEVLADRKGILLTHTGPLTPPSRARFSDPMRLADLAVDFPEITVIAAHMGAVDWRPWANLAAFQPNFYGDLAMWDVPAFGHYELFCRELRDIIDLVGPSKVLFGTDGPVYPVAESPGDWVRLIKDLPERAPEGIRFTREEADAILGGNAARILGLG